MAASLASLRDRLRLLAAVDAGRQAFGASTHQYELSAPITSADLAAFEATVGELPADYRAFLLELGTHGAGPYYGLVASPQVFEGEHRGVLLADQGCGGRSLLIVDGPHRGQVWSDWREEGGEMSVEAPGFLEWYSQWLDNALVEWICLSATRIVLDGPRSPQELEAITNVFDDVAKRSVGNADLLRTLGYLHARERRWDDARAAFDQASTLAGDEPTTRRHLDLARMYFVMEAYTQSIDEATRGLAAQDLWHSTGHELRDTLERAYTASGRIDEALAVLDARCEEAFYELSLHHRLAREYIARGNVEAAGRALERALSMNGLFEDDATMEQRITATFDPIIAELSARQTAIEGAYLENLLDTIRSAN